MTKRVASIVSLHGKPIWRKGVRQPEVVELLQEVLTLAKRGEIHGVHMVLVHDDGVARKARAGRVNYATIGCLNVLAQGLADEVVSE